MNINKVTITPYLPQALPLKGLDLIPLIPWIGKAREALARYDESLKISPRILLEPLKMAESIASALSQDIRTTMEKVYLGDATDPNIKKVWAIHEGLNFAIDWVKTRPISTPFFCEVHALVKEDSESIADVGKIRTRQNWIGPEGAPVEKAYFFPPPAARVDGCLRMLYRYLRGKEVDPLVQTAIAFAQFLIIHPFMDANGRVARIFIPSYLYKRKLTITPALFLSNYCFTHSNGYFGKLFDISQTKDWESWILYFLKGVIDQAEKQKRTLDALFLLLRKVEHEVFFHKPIATRESFTKTFGSMQSKHLTHLLKEKVFVPVSKETWAFRALFRLVELR